MRQLSVSHNTSIDQDETYLKSKSGEDLSKKVSDSSHSEEIRSRKKSNSVKDSPTKYSGAKLEKQYSNS